ncbi:Outer membrane protein beta-barrel domain-containing protein [Mariniphaga anaerophila]|uniref:Outer membrane protein beta-barrel domain-containing protein n=1 Tax=Mariniphaga anaerophila TaxID=1484053 RepID=A0A1M5CH54_9BACT|nr:outer membrane beta-barrel protein [Mariniphaga anaerophila]SHF54036.1 Outer membrane protein beta-barrel domain-containing protein [Mariniphaga anaerophila]
MNNKSIYYITICLAALCFFCLVENAAAQSSVAKNELSVYVQGGSSFLNYSSEMGGEREMGFGIGGGIQYAVYLDSSWSVSIGAGLQQYHSKNGFSDLDVSYATTDTEGDPFEYMITMETLNEDQWVYMLNIPVRIQYETLGEKTRFFGAAGFQWGVPLSSRFQSRATNLETSGYYPEWDAVLESPLFAGFGNWNELSGEKEDLELKHSYGLQFELGIKQMFGENQRIYAGVYADLGLNDLKKTGIEKTRLVGYNNDDPGQPNLGTVIYAAHENRNFVKKVSMRGFGIRLRYAFTW